MGYSQELKDAINRVTYLKGARERALDIGDQDLLKWADNELLKPYDYIRNESRGDYELIRNNPYSELQQYNARVQAEPAYVSPPRVEMPNPYEGMGDVKAADYTPSTPGEQRMIIEMPRPYPPGGGDRAYPNDGPQKNSTPVIEMPNPYKRYDNIGSGELTAGTAHVKMPAPNKLPTLDDWRLRGETYDYNNSQGRQLPGEPSRGSAIPLGSFNYNQSGASNKNQENSRQPEASSGGDPIIYNRATGRKIVFSQNQYDYLTNMALTHPDPGNRQWAIKQLNDGLYYYDPDDPNNNSNHKNYFFVPVSDFAYQGKINNRAEFERLPLPIQLARVIYDEKR